ncbi:Dabb family protein [Euzebyella marina]|uniref:Dabb family protein n=1 Tax=Euzebyella marina TaxID=1761453 RepID=A0A3G2L937_9FLAO|nr:Dabb family protein [Euzebyella marina]AYN68754.1 Dabb family protein [Euzebyella marina]
MKSTKLALVLLFIGYGTFAMKASTLNNNNINFTMEQDSVLRHVVMFKFKEGTAQADIDKVQEAFSALPSKIPQIASYEWGTNNSPEGHDKGFTHCFFLTFKSEADRAIYLPHPDHKAFGGILGPYLDDVMVLDYWSKE